MRTPSILAVVALGLASLCLAAGPANAQSDVIFSNFNPADFADPLSPYFWVAWPVGGGIAQGDRFSIEATEPHYLVGIELPVTMWTVPAGVEQLTVSLCRDAGGQPGEVLESFSFGGMSEGQSVVLEGTSESHPLLDPGTLYWFTVSAPSNASLDWAATYPAVSGLHKYYFGGSWHTGYSQMGCFRIFGSVSEPGSSLEVGIDIKPGSSQNTFNVRGGGVIPVAILGSPDFDVTWVDIGTVEFAGLRVRTTGNGKPQCTVRDVNGDGNPDLVCQFVDNLKEWPAGQTEATLTGYLLDEVGTPFTGTDVIRIVP